MPFSATRDLWLILKARDEGARALRSFASDIRHVGDSVRMANLQAARSALVNQQSMNRLSGATQAQMLLTQNQISNIDRQISQEKLHRASMEEHRVMAQRLGAAMHGVSSAFTTAGTIMTATGVFGAFAMKNLVDSAIEYQRQVAHTRTQVDGLRYSMDELGAVGLRVARTIGIPFEQIQPALFDIFSSMEVNIEDAEKLLVAFSKAGVAGQTDIQSAARATIGILNAFQLPVTDVNKLLDLQFQLVQEGIGTYEEWNQRIGLVTPSAVRAGQSVETMLAALAVTTRMGISAARSGTAVARAFDAMSHPRSVEAMKKLGVNALDANGKFRPLIEVLGEFRTKLMALPEAERTKKLLEVFKGAGGTIEARRFLQNMLLTPGNLELFKSIFDEMSNTTGSFEAAYNTMANTAATKSQLLANQWQAVKIAAGEALIPTFMTVVGWLGKLFEWFNNLSPQQQQFISKAILIGVALTGVAGVLLLIVGTIAGVVAAFATAGTAITIFLGVMTALGAILAVAAVTFKTLWERSADFRGIISDLSMELQKFWKEYVIPTALAIKQAWDQYMGPALEKLWRVIQEKVMPIWRELSSHVTAEFLDKAKEIFNVVKDSLIVAFQKVSEIIEFKLIPLIETATQFYHEHEAQIKQVVGWVMTFLGWIGKLIAILLGGLIMVVLPKLFEGFIGVVSAIMMFVAGIIRLIEWVKEAWQWLKNLVSYVKMFFTADTFKAIGESIVQGIINGITGMIGKARNTITSLAGNAVSWMREKLGANSPSREFMKLGKDSMAGYVLGLRNSMPMLAAQAVSATAGLTSAITGNQASGSNRTYNQNITIHTQELDPRRQAAELGWLLSGSTP